MHVDTPGYTDNAFIRAQDDKNVPCSVNGYITVKKKGLILYCIKLALTKYSITLEPALQ